MRKLLMATITMAIIACLIPAVATAVVDPSKKATGASKAKIQNNQPCVVTFNGGTIKNTLYAGQHIDVGYVEFKDDGTDLTITYTITDPNWCITETHWYAGTTPPAKAAPGQFPYGDDNLDCVTSYVETVPLSEFGGCTELYVAAHAVVFRIVGYEEPDLDAFAGSLPDQVFIQAVYPGGDSYFNTTVTGGTVLDGTYDGWCIDTDRTISSSKYTAQVYSSYESIPTGLVEKPQNLDLVNWIINQGFVGQTSACGGTYTFGDVQRAIWTLIDDQNSTSGLGNWSQCRVDEIVAAAEANGEGFVPECNGFVAVILVPVLPGGGNAQVIIAQVTFIDVGLPCDPSLGEDETAWAKGDCEFKQGWGSYYGYVPCD